ncbi:FAD-dependent oxidoreductase [Pararhodobacter marinus]|uniref:FAD-dependent oxidoreductase n=1 Tax=Pararhodobacter marinus TaxID=2184063 RepID=UPI0035139427
MTGLDIIIIGAGIAGCSAAIALTQAGHRVRVLEKQTEWRFQSSGIFVYSNGLETLDDLGLLDDILATGFAVDGGENAYFDHHGTPLTTTHYPTARNGRVPAILGIKRAELHRVLSQRMDALGVQVTLGAEVTALDPAGGMTLADGTELRADLILGADGVRSWTRAQLAPGVEPRYTGFGIWRSVHERPADLTQKIMMMGPAKRFGIMPISDDRLYTFGTVAHPKGRHIDPTDWPGAMRAALAEFDGPAAPFLSELNDDSEILFTAVDEVVMPLPWHHDRVLLIGDAAHASTPFMGQGGAMAMQDALVLARILRAGDDLETALATFGTLRLPVCQFVQDVSRAVGEAGADEDLASLPQRHEQLRATAQDAVDGFYARLRAMNAEADAKIAALA